MPGQGSFGDMSLDELVEMRNQLGRAIDDKVAAERAELQTRLEALSGYRVEGGSIVGPGKGRRGRPANGRRAHPLAGRKVPAKYRGPNGETWSGRGLAPRWLSALEQKGKKRDRYLVS
jgi:DNA-binding protein H-NS